MDKRTVKRCSECGLCKTVCPIFKATLNEYESPRAKAILGKNEILDQVWFDCTMCKSCERVCPLKIDFDFINVRNRINKSGNAPQASIIMLENTKLYGNPFGKLEKGKKPKNLYCC